MNDALADLLTTMGYPIEGFGQATAHIVSGPRPAGETDDDASQDDQVTGNGPQEPREGA